MDVVQRRKALADALSAHDTEGVKSFLHPSFVVRGADGVVVMDYARFLSELPAFFNGNPRYRQSMESEMLRVEGDTATLTTRRVEVLRTLWWSHHVSSRWNETWKRIGGEWVLVEETPNLALDWA